MAWRGIRDPKKNSPYVWPSTIRPPRQCWNVWRTALKTQLVSMDWKLYNPLKEWVLPIKKGDCIFNEQVGNLWLKSEHDYVRYEIIREDRNKWSKYQWFGITTHQDRWIRGLQTKVYQIGEDRYIMGVSETIEKERDIMVPQWDNHQISLDTHKNG